MTITVAWEVAVVDTVIDPYFSDLASPEFFSYSRMVSLCMLMINYIFSSLQPELNSLRLFCSLGYQV